MKNKKRNKIVNTSLVTLMAVSSMASVTNVYAQTPQDKVGENIIHAHVAGQEEGSKVVQPDAPVQFKLNANKDTLDSLHLIYENGELAYQGEVNENNDKFGVLITDGTNYFLSLPSSGEVKLSTDGSTLTITAEHEELDRYRDYEAFLLVGSALNHIQSEQKSNGQSQAFAKYLDKFKQTSPNQTIEFKTGSAVGEPTKFEPTIATTTPSVSEGTKIVVEAKDDYGNPANSGSVEVIEVRTTDGTQLSETFEYTPTALFKDGKAEIALSNKKAQSVEVKVRMNNPFEITRISTFASQVNVLSVDTRLVALASPTNTTTNTTTSGTVATYQVNFQAGDVQDISLVTDKTTANINDTIILSGTARDQYGNPVQSGTPVSVQMGSTVLGVVNTDQNGDYSYSYNATTSGTLNFIATSNTIVSNSVSATVNSTTTNNNGNTNPNTNGNTNAVAGVPTSVTLWTWTSSYTGYGTVIATIKDGNGNPVPNVSVSLYQDVEWGKDELERTVTTNSEGEAEFTLRGEGSMKVYVLTENGVKSEVKTITMGVASWYGGW